MRIIPHSRPCLGQAEERAALRVIRAGQLSEGPETDRLVRQLCDVVGAAGGIATSSGTAALHLALLALGVHEGDEVVLPSYVCPALLYAVRYVRANPVLVDIGDDGYNLTSRTVRAALTRKTKAVMVPHMFGMPADLDGLSSLGIPIIEDCAQALGGSHGGRPLGGFGTISVFSFYATKMVAAAGGGFLASSNAEMIRKADDLGHYNGKKGTTLRFNYRISNLQAALARSQLRRLNSFVRSRKAIAKRYSAAFQSLDIGLPLPPAGTLDHIYYRYVLLVPGPADDFRRRMLQRGVQCGHGVLEPLHRSLGLPSRNFRNSERALAHAVSIPIYPALAAGEVTAVAAAVRHVLNNP